MNKKIGIIGGDLRIIRLAEIYAKDEFVIYTYGLEEKVFSYKNILKCDTLEDINNNCNYVISGIPFSKDGVYVYTPFSNRKIEIKEVLEKLQNRTLIAGAISPEFKEKSNKIIDLMENEGLTIKNIIPTVEGAIQVAMKNIEFTINNSNCLVLGFGRIGKLLCKTLRDLGANVTCMARKESDLTWIKVLGYTPININNLEKSLNNNYDIIFNTIPSLILDANKLEIIKSNKLLIIELASSPGGIDFQKAKEYNINVIKALGLPGKVAPLTAAKNIKEFLDESVWT